MKAIVHHTYGSPDVLELADVERPSMADDEVLVRVRAAAINPLDWHLLTGEPYLFRVQFGLRRPRATGVGVDVAGVVEAVGGQVSEWHPGDEVYGAIDDATLRAHPDRGTLAEYACVPATMLVRKPSSSTFEQAAAVPAAGLTALQAIRDWAGVQPGQRLLVNGASGGVGTFAVQIARHLGADVTAVCSTPNLDLVRSLGADRAIDYTREDFTSGSVRYDAILDNVGNRSLSDCRRALLPDGVYVASFGQPEHRWLGPMLFLARMAIVSPLVRQRFVTKVSEPNGPDLWALNELVRAGVVRPVVDRTYRLDEAAEAMQYLERGHARGKVVVTV